MADQLVSDQLFFEVLAGITNVEDEQRLKDIAQTLDVEIGDEVQGRRALVRLIQNYLNGDEFAALNRPVMDEALQNVWEMLQPEPPQPILDQHLQGVQEDPPPPADKDTLENGEGGDLALGVLEVQSESLRSEYDGNESYELVVSSSEETVNPLSEEDDELLDHPLGGETGTHNNPNDEADNDAGDGHPDSQLGGDTGTQNKPIDNGDGASTTTEDYQSAVTHQSESDSDNTSTGLPSAFCRRSKRTKQTKQILTYDTLGNPRTSHASRPRNNRSKR